MFERESLLNQFLLDGFKAIVKDIPAERMYEPAPGHGHPPVWILGHLAICAELGQKLCGNSIAHPDWLQTFGPGSSDNIADTGEFQLVELAGAIVEGYPVFAELAGETNASDLSASHGVALLEGSRIETVGDLISHLLTTHFSFHLAQLSGWRRAAGHPPLF